MIFDDRPAPSEYMDEPNQRECPVCGERAFAFNHSVHGHQRLHGTDATLDIYRCAACGYEEAD